MYSPARAVTRVGDDRYIVDGIDGQFDWHRMRQMGFNIQHIPEAVACKGTMTVVGGKVKKVEKGSGGVVIRRKKPGNS